MVVAVYGYAGVSLGAVCCVYVLESLSGACWCSSCVYVAFNDRDD